MFVIYNVHGNMVSSIHVCVCVLDVVYQTFSLFCYKYISTDASSKPVSPRPYIPADARFYPRPESKVTEDDLGDYIKMNPVSNLSSTLPAAARYQAPDFTQDIEQLCRSYDGLLGLGN